LLEFCLASIYHQKNWFFFCWNHVLEYCSIGMTQFFCINRYLAVDFWYWNLNEFLLLSFSSTKNAVKLNTQFPFSKTIWRVNQMEKMQV
jgi:hypothetical protein